MECVIIRSAPTKFQFLAASQMSKDKILLINHVESSFGARMFEHDDLADEDENLMIKLKFLTYKLRKSNIHAIHPTTHS